jgi:hypothetical protein
MFRACGFGRRRVARRRCDLVGIGVFGFELIHQHAGANFITLALIADNMHQIGTRETKVILFAQLKQSLQVDTGHSFAPK